MTLEDFLGQIGQKRPPAPEGEVRRFESEIGSPLPPDYREFLIRCNGGFLGGQLWFFGPTPEGAKADAGVHHILGFREESYFSLRWNRDCFQGGELRLPRQLIKIMDDPFGNAICIGLAGPYRGRIYFWDHENEPDPEEWDGSVETAGNLSLLAHSFTEFVEGLKRNTDE